MHSKTWFSIYTLLYMYEEKKAYRYKIEMEAHFTFGNGIQLGIQYNNNQWSHWKCWIGTICDLRSFEINLSLHEDVVAMFSVHALNFISMLLRKWKSPRDLEQKTKSKGKITKKKCFLLCCRRAYFFGLLIQHFAYLLFTLEYSLEKV